MELSVRTVEEHRRRIFERLRVHPQPNWPTLLAQARAIGVPIESTEPTRWGPLSGDQNPQQHVQQQSGTSQNYHQHKAQAPPKSPRR